MDDFICIKGKKHYFVVDEKNKDTCYKCSLKEICNISLSIDSRICDIYEYTTEGKTGHFEEK